MKAENSKLSQENEELSKTLAQAEKMLAQVSKPTRKPNFKSSSSVKQVNVTDSNTTEVHEEKRRD